MKLHWSPRSPFVRKVMIVLHETGLVDRVELVRSVAAMTRPNPDIMRDNPLSKIPTLVLDDGVPIHDSAVICEYLDALTGTPRLFPAGGAQRWDALVRQAGGDGLLDALVLWRNELSRVPERRDPALLSAFSVKVTAMLDRLERNAGTVAALPFDIGHIAVGCALSYMDFRFTDISWRSSRPQLAAWHAQFEERSSARLTRPIDDGQ